MDLLESPPIGHSSLLDSPSLITIPIMTSTARPSPSHAQGRKRRKASSTDEAQDNSRLARAKRNRYVSIACNECKRRKIKCNGNTPCRRCGNLSLQCEYAPHCSFKDSDEFIDICNQLVSLQEQVNTLHSNVVLRSERQSMPSNIPNQCQHPESIPRQSNTARKSTFRPLSSRVCGPTSSAFGIDIAKSTLNQMGYPGMKGVEETTQDNTPLGSPPSRALPHPQPFSNNSPPDSPPSLSLSYSQPFNRDFTLRSPPLQALSLSQPLNRDPIWALDKTEAIRLCNLYEREIGVLYPILNIDEIIAHTKTLYEFIEAGVESGLMSEAYLKVIQEAKSNVLKIVLACGLMVETCGQSDLASQLYDSVKPSTDGMLYNEHIDMPQLTIITLMSIYYFHCDEEALARRMIGYVAHMCIELGLHRRETLIKHYPDAAKRDCVLKFFWSVYVLDRRWSFGVGLPFVMQDANIDPALPEPVLRIPYLNAMIAFCRITGQVWAALSTFDPIIKQDLKKKEIGYLDFQILEWQRSFPSELQLPAVKAPQTRPQSRAMYRLQILLYLRANQLRILIYRPVLYSASSIVENLIYAQTAVSLAKDTICALSHLDQTTDIYRSHQSMFNHFLSSALAVLFLASCHAPIQFSDICREEFYIALNLIKGLSAKSYVSKRLWKTIRGLKRVGPRLGLTSNNDQVVNASLDDAHSAVPDMARLADHDVSCMDDHYMGSGGSENSPMDGFHMSHEMANLFESALGNTSGVDWDGCMKEPPTDGIRLSPMSGANVFGGEDELFRQFRDLF